MNQYMLIRIYRPDKVRLNEYKGKLQNLYPMIEPTDADTLGFLFNVAEGKCPMYTKIEESGLKRLCLSHDCPITEMNCALKEMKQ